MADTEYWPEVLQAIPVAGYKVYIYFDDGRIKLYDASKLVTQGAFRQLTENNLFFDACTVLNHTLAWTPDGSYSEWTCLDLDAAALYAECPTVEEPAWVFERGNQEA